jgi:toxin FitB
VSSVVDDDVVLSVLSIGELRTGIERFARRDPQTAGTLEKRLALVLEWFGGKVLPITVAIADRWGRPGVPDPVPTVDGLLAATALVHGLTVVTRNVQDFARCGAPVIDPWK